MNKKKKKFGINIPNWKKIAEKKIDDAFLRMTIEKYPEFQDLIPMQYAMKQINIMLADLKAEHKMLSSALNTKIGEKEKALIESRVAEYQSEIDHLESEMIGTLLDLGDKTEQILGKDSSAERLMAWHTHGSHFLEERRDALMPDQDMVERN